MERFHRAVAESADCWLWSGPTSGGRPIMSRGAADKSNMYARRVAWELYRGAIPRGSEVRSSCKTRLCVRPEHLICRPKKLRGLVATPSHKRCFRCTELKAASEFAPRAQKSDGLETYCKPCVRDRRRSTALSRHGLSVAQYDEMLRLQGGRCAACGADDPKGRGGFKVDHDHSSGRVRGLLCTGCNLALGHAKDDPVRLRKLATYLEAHL